MSNQVQIQFTASGCSSSTGNFAPGDLLRCSKAEAEHFVHAAACAQYVVAPAAKLAAAVKLPKPAQPAKADAKGKTK